MGCPSECHLPVVVPQYVECLGALKLCRIPVRGGEVHDHRLTRVDCLRAEGALCPGQARGHWDRALVTKDLLDRRGCAARTRVELARLVGMAEQEIQTVAE